MSSQDSGSHPDLKSNSQPAVTRPTSNMPHFMVSSGGTRQTQLSPVPNPAVTLAIDIPNAQLVSRYNLPLEVKEHIDTILDTNKALLKLISKCTCDANSQNDMISQFSSFQERSSQVIANMEQFMIEKDKLERENAQLRENVQKLEKQVKDLDKELAEQRSINDDQRNLIRGLRTQVADLEATVAKQFAEIAALKAKLEEQCIINDQQRAKIEQQDSRIAAQSARIEQQDSKIADLTNDAIVQKAINDKLLARLDKIDQRDRINQTYYHMAQLTVDSLRELDKAQGVDKDTNSKAAGIDYQEVLNIRKEAKKIEIKEGEIVLDPISQAEVDEKLLKMTQTYKLTNDIKEFDKIMAIKRRRNTDAHSDEDEIRDFVSENYKLLQSELLPGEYEALRTLLEKRKIHVEGFTYKVVEGRKK